MARKEPAEKYYCPQCLEEVAKNATRCPHCEVEYEAGEEEAGFECMICANEVAPDAKFCEKCGTKFLDMDEDEGEALVKQIGEHGRKRGLFEDLEQDDS